MAAVYAEMRQEEAQAQVPHSYTTARTLLSILRLSQALARLRFSDYVCQVWHSSHAWLAIQTVWSIEEFAQGYHFCCASALQPHVDRFWVSVGPSESS